MAQRFHWLLESMNLLDVTSLLYLHVTFFFTSYGNTEVLKFRWNPADRSKIRF